MFSIGFIGLSIAVGDITFTDGSVLYRTLMGPIIHVLSLVQEIKGLSLRI